MNTMQKVGTAAMAVGFAGLATSYAVPIDDEIKSPLFEIFVRVVFTGLSTKIIGDIRADIPDWNSFDDTNPKTIVRLVLIAIALLNTASKSKLFLPMEEMIQKKNFLTCVSGYCASLAFVKGIYQWHRSPADGRGADELEEVKIA